jgi:hypothetical protein
MKAIFKTEKEFLDMGFKPDYRSYYDGDKKSPRATVRTHLIENLGGQEVEITHVENVDRGHICIRFKSSQYQVETWMLRGKILFKEIHVPKELKMRGKKAVFFGIGFSFPCDFSDLRTQEAVKVAKWILKVSRSKGK